MPQIAAKARPVNTIHSFLPALTRRFPLEKTIQTGFWFLVFLSWLPIIAGHVGLIDNFIPGRWGPLPDGRWLAIPWRSSFVLLTVAIGTLAAFIDKRYLIFALPPLLANFLSEAGLLKDTVTYLSIAYTASFVVCLYCFARWGHIRSLALVLLGLFLLWDSVVETAQWISYTAQEMVSADFEAPQDYHSDLSALDLLLSSYSISFAELLVFFALIIFARFLALFYEQNIELARTLITNGYGNLLREYVVPALKLWSPMLGVFLLFGCWFYPYITDLFSRQVAKSIMLHLEEDGYREAKTNDPQLEPMTRHLIEFNRRKMIEQATKSINEIQWASVTSSQHLKTLVYPKLENEVFPPRLPGSQTKRCRKTSMPCHAGNGVKSLANTGYRRLRDPPLSATKRNIEQLHQAVGINSADFAAKAKSQVTQDVNVFAARAHTAFDKALYASRMLSVIMLIYSLMVLTKTYGIVLARFIFDINNGKRMHARLSNEEVVPRSRREFTSTVEHVEQPYSLKDAEGFNYYLTRDLSLPAGLPMAWYPFPAKAVLTRLSSRTYLMSYVEVVGNAFDEVSLDVPGTTELVRWRIAEGERVVFRWQDLVGFSEGLRIETRISFSLQALVFGRVVFHTAVGSGVLFLRTTRRPVVGEGEEEAVGPRQARDAAALLSWQSRTPFEIQSDLNFKGVFLRGYNIEKQEEGSVVYSSTVMGGSTARLGIARWIRTFLSPI